MNGFRMICKEVTVSNANDVVNVSWKLDKKSVLLTGVMASVVESDAHSSTQRICEAGMTFADKSDTVHIPVDNKPIGEHEKYALQELKQILHHNVNVDGYVNDFGVSAHYPYTVTIVFRVVDNPKT